MFRCEAAHGVKWIQGPKLFAKFRDAMSDAETESRTRRPFSAARLLLISDVCRAGCQLTDYQRSALYDVIDSRYSNRRPTWITTNAANRDELETMLGDDIADRLLDGALVVPCIWDSFRRELKRQENERENGNE